MNVNHNVWYESFDEPFLKISWESKVPKKWMSFDDISGKYKDSIIKPINRYAEMLYPVPELISVDSERVILRQSNHAEIYLLVNEDGIFYNVDRPWVRQYYQSKLPPHCNDCFPGVYRAYVPWIIDLEVDVEFRNVPDSPFVIRNSMTNFIKIKPDIGAIEPIMIPFSFSKTGKHMKENNLGIIKVGTPMFDIIIKSNKDIEKKVREFYASYQVSPIHRRNV